MSEGPPNNRKRGPLKWTRLRSHDVSKLQHMTDMEPVEPLFNQPPSDQPDQRGGEIKGVNVLGADQ